MKRLLLALVPAIGLVAPAHADVFVTGTETANQAALGGSTSFNQVIRVNGTAFGGRDFGNDITSTSPTAGDLVNIITVDQITSYNRNGSPSNPLSNFGNNTGVIVAAIQGKLVSVGGGFFNVQILNGRAGFYAQSQATYDPLHPATYGATNAAGTTFNTPVAQYTLHTPVDVVPGPKGESDNFPASQVNSTSVNTVAGTTSQGRFLFGEDFNGGFLVVDPVTGQKAVGQLGLSQAQIQTTNLATSSFTAADQAALNTIFSNLDPFASGFSQFATFGSGTATDFNPGNPAGTGDAEQSFSLAVDPGNFFAGSVPEPATISLWALILGSGGVAGLVRRYRARRAAQA
jgi:hypothetical protein